MKRSSWNILMNMLKSFLLDEMFPNVCDKLCKLFSKQKTFNFTQHIPPWKEKEREGIRRVEQRSCCCLGFGSGLSTTVSTIVARSAKRCMKV